MDLEKALAHHLSAALRGSRYLDVDVAIEIAGAESKRSLFSLDAERPYIPASAVKIFPSAISLIRLGAETRFVTPLETTGEIDLGVLRGNLYLVGRGDPSLTDADLERAAREIRNRGIHRVVGDLVYDVTFLDEEKPCCPPNARHLYAPPGALTVNNNSILLDLDDGPPPRLGLIPQTSYGLLRYDIEVLSSDQPGRPTMTYREKPWGDEYTVQGTVTDWDKHFNYLRLAVSRPGLYAATLLRETLERQGIELTGELRQGKAPVGAQMLAELEGRPLAEVVRALNQESNNVVAELVNKDLGALLDEPPGTRAKGLEILRRYLIEEIGFVPESFSLADASGLSTDNRMSARQFTQALGHFFEKVGWSFVETLARQGHHPHARYPVPPDSIRIYSKSGTLPATGVNTVVGYLDWEPSGEVVVFAVLTRRRSQGQPAFSGTLTNPLLGAIVASFEAASE